MSLIDIHWPRECEMGITVFIKSGSYRGSEADPTCAAAEGVRTVRGDY